MQETLHEIAACIAAATSLALVLRGWHHHRRYRRAVAAQRMRHYGKRRAGTQPGHEQVQPEGERLGVEHRDQSQLNIEPPKGI